jgi:hypothetical protein
MANIVGKNGVVKGGTAGSESVIGEVTGFSINQTADTIETSTMGSADRSYVTSLKSFSGSVDVLHSVTAGDNQSEFAVGSSLQLELYPNGTTSGEKYFEGTVLCTGKDVTSTFNDMVTATFSFQGTGQLEEKTAS